MQRKTRTLFSIICALQFAAVAFLIICCVTAPVFKQIGLSKYDDITYGVFGYCETGKSCSTASASYNPNKLASDDDNWKMGDRTRSILGKILVITPVAAGLNFISFLSTIITFIISAVNGPTSAASFTINLVFSIIAFLSSALMCIVIFLLFYPNVTWCSWLLIPAAVLPLIIIPLIFVAHSTTSDDDETDDDLLGIVQHDDVAESQFASPDKNVDFYKEMSGDNTATSLTEKPLIVPNYGYGNYNKQDSVVKINTSTTDQSTMSKEKLNDFEYDEAERNSHTAFSAINSDNNRSNSHQNKAPYSAALSLASSEYSDKNFSQAQTQNNSRGVLEDIIKDSILDDRQPNGVNHMKSVSDNGSDFTSISQRAAQQQPGPVQGGQMMGNRVPGVMDYATPQQKQQRMPNYVRPAGPDPSDLVLQNNPNFINPGQKRMQPQSANFNHYPQQYFPQNQHPQQQQKYYQQRQPNAYGGFQNNYNPNAVPNTAPVSSTHYKPAYKKRMGAKNMMPPASALNRNNPYEFR